VGIAGGLLLVIIGAVLAFAVQVDTGPVDIQVIGWIVLLGGLFSLGLSLWRMNATRRREVYIRRNPGDRWQTEIEEDRVERTGDTEPPP
jgi:hypothetical protein